MSREKKSCDKVSDFSQRCLTKNAECPPQYEVNPQHIKSDMVLPDSSINTAAASVAPPKPIRQPTLKRGCERPKIEIRHKEINSDDENDYSDYAMVKSLPAEQVLLVQEEMEKLKISFPPVSVSNSAFNLPAYASRLLLSENKPLDPSIMSITTSLLSQNSPIILAKHIALLDFHLLKIVTPVNLGLGVQSGIELITLPQGHQLRLDILERYNCLKYFVASCILTCSNMVDRSKMLEKWLLTAHELYSTLGDHLSFAAVMEGTSMKQVVKLQSTWTNLSPDIVTKCRNVLLPLCASMEQATNYLPVGGNITIPYIIPVAKFLIESQVQKAKKINNENVGSATNNDQTGSASKTFARIENCDSFKDLTTVLNHLDTARLLADQWPTYRQVAHKLIDGFRANIDLLDMFRTEFHLKLLWGFRGATVAVNERYQKFEQILCALSARIEAAPGDRV